MLKSTYDIMFHLCSCAPGHTILPTDLKSDISNPLESFLDFILPYIDKYSLSMKSTFSRIKGTDKKQEKDDKQKGLL